MTMGQSIVRVVIGVIGICLMALAIGLFVTNGPFFGIWVWTFVGGAILLIGVLIERSRYRSQAAEKGQLSPGPGGGEPGPVEPRFRPTDEVFVDPTTNHRMRVYLDSRTGERRYVAEA
jgi:hypothetical protein